MRGCFPRPPDGRRVIDAEPSHPHMLAAELHKKPPVIEKYESDPGVRHE